MTQYRAQGKQVLQDDKHFADAVGEVEALMIVNALRAVDGRADPLYLVGEVTSETVIRRQPTLNLNTCRKRREGDEFACMCGLRWAADDPDPPRCVHRAD